MAGLELLPRQRFELLLTDGSKIAGKFGTYATSMYCERRGLTLTQFHKNILIFQTDDKGNPIVDDSGVRIQDIKIQDLIEYTLCACESAARTAGERYNFSAAKLCEWADDYGSDTGDYNVLIKVFGHSFPKATEKKNQELQPETQNTTT